MINSTTDKQKKYRLDYLIKLEALFENRKVKDIVSDLEEILGVSSRKIYYLKQATLEQTSTDYTMNEKQRNLIAKYFKVPPEELDNQ